MRSFSPRCYCQLVALHSDHRIPNIELAIKRSESGALALNPIDYIINLQTYDLIHSSYFLYDFD